MSKTGPAFKPLTKKPQRKKTPFIPSSVKKKKDGVLSVGLSEVMAKKAVKKEAVIGNKKSVVGKNILEIQKGKIQEVAKTQKTHDTPKQKVDETQKAVTVTPALQKSSKAKSNQVEVMADQKPKKFDAAKFSQDILNNIKKVIPKNKEEMEKDQSSSEKMGVAQQNVTDTLETEKTNSGGDIENSVVVKPDESSIALKETAPLPKENIGPNPTIPNAGFAPPLKSKKDNDLSADSKKIDTELDENKVSENQLQNANEPSFDQSLEEKKQSQANAKETNNQYLVSAKPIASASKTTTGSLIASGMSKMGAKRNANLKSVDESKAEKKQKEETIRIKVARDLNDIYDATQKKVDGILLNLKTKVDFIFDTALALANQNFEANVRARTSTSFWDDPLLWVADLVVGLPRDMEKVFREEQDNFINFLKPVVVKIGEFVEQELTKSVQEIEIGKQKTKSYWDNQDKDTKKIATDIFANATGKFTELESKVDEANESLKSSITTKFNEAVSKLEETFEKIKEENKSWLEKAYDAVVGVIQAIIEMKNLLLTVLAKVADTVVDIILDPIGFLSNLLDAVILGFKNFGKNALEHLKKGFFEWLLGNMPPSIKFPKQWDLKGIFEFVMSVLGLTWDNIKSRATKMYGATVVTALETGFEIFQIIRKDGIGGLWEHIKGKIGDLKVMVIDAIQNMLIEQVVKAGITWVIGLFNPAGAFIKACKLIYDVISWFINNAKRILDLINSIVDSTALIVQGKIGQAAQFVENSLAKLIPIAIGFLAGLLGIGDLSKRVQALLDKIQAPINKAIDWVLEMAGKAVKGLISAGKAGVKKVLSWLGFKKEFTAKDKKQHSVNVEGSDKDPKIIIRSTPKTLDELIAEFRTTDVYKNDKAKYEVNIKEAKSIYSRFLNALKKNQGDQGPNFDKEVETMAQSLIDHVKELFVAPSSTDTRKVDFDENDGVSTLMDANPLMKKDGVVGQSTSPAKGLYEELSARKTKSGSKSFYVQGHLLNAELDGPNTKNNLTPLTTHANDEHKSIIETKLKIHYAAGKKLKYKVKPTYGLSSPEIDNPEKKDARKEIINSIKRVERKSVPINLVINSSYFVKEGDKEVEKNIYNGTINNKVETEEKDYVLNK